MTRFGFVRAAITRDAAWWHGPVTALTCVGIATGLRLLIGEAATDVPFVTYYPAIMVSALLAGWRWGLAATAASMAVANYMFVGQRMSFATDLRSLLIGVLFFASCAIIVAIAQTLRRTFIDLDRTNARAEFLNRELRHRVRNTLAVVQALAEQTARSHSTDFVPTLNARLQALAKAQDVMGTEGEHGCELHTVIEQACAPFRDGDNLTIAGPPCDLPRGSCVPLSLAIHELCTNAVKHGALSIATGRVFISWERDEHGGVQLVWEEAGGPPVFPPKRKGLGTQLLTAQSELKRVSLEYHPRGLRCAFGLDCYDASGELRAPAASTGLAQAAGSHSSTGLPSAS